MTTAADQVSADIRWVAETAGKMRPVPRPRNGLPDEWVERLRADKAAADKAQEKLKATVREALEHGSVRRVADALGLSPTTIMAWKAER